MKYLSKFELLNLKLYRWRHDDYFNSNWRFEKIKLSELGVWPKMSGIPDNFCVGNLCQTAECIKRLLKKKDRKYQKLFEKIDKLLPYVKIINRYLPLIVIKNGNIRTSRRNFNFFKYHQTLYDIDDGNHKAIALALLGEKSANAYVGERVFNNEILF
ncbi:MAG: hypothetical protein GF347_03790 [Candidatus Moranbacteria bacterium]|nr:hypothetical protein [Candidatus Moranbacteria bacterium]